MYSYLETLPQWLETTIIAVILIVMIIVIIGFGYFILKIVNKIKDIKLKVAGAEVDIQVEAPTNTPEIKQSEGAEK